MDMDLGICSSQGRQLNTICLPFFGRSFCKSKCPGTVCIVFPVLYLRHTVQVNSSSLMTLGKKPFGLEGHVVLIISTQTCPWWHRRTHGIDNMQTNECGCVPIKLHLQKQVVGWI